MTQSQVMKDDDLEYRFESIDVKEESIVGEAPSLREPVRIPDRDWTEVDDLEGNWEPVTEAVIDANLNDLIRTNIEANMDDIDGLQVTLNELTAAIEAKEIIADSEAKTTALRSRLLAEYLVKEGVYRADGGSVKILEKNFDSADVRRYLNWAVLFRSISISIIDAVDHANQLSNQSADYPGFQPANVPGELDGLKNWNIIESDEFEQENEVSPVKQLGVCIDELEAYQERFRNLEQNMRQKSIPQIVDVPEVQEHLRNVANIAKNFDLMGERSVGDDQEVDEMISKSTVESESGGSDRSEFEGTAGALGNEDDS